MSGKATGPVGVVVRRVGPDEWPRYRELRLDALRSDPLAFGSTLSRESAFPESTWRDRCQRAASAETESVFVAAPPDGRLVGMAGSFTADGAVHVVGMWVRPEWRRRRVAQHLMMTLLDWVEEHQHDLPVELEVNPDLEGAVRLYLSLGFEFTGEERPLGHDPPAVVRTMALPHRPTT